VNYDLHFNPQVAVQRAGRVDRLGSPHQTVYLVSFLPPEGLEKHIGLLARLDERFRRIHGLGLGDEQVTPLAADRQAHTLEQIRRLYADDASVLDEVERTWTLGSTDSRSARSRLRRTARPHSRRSSRHLASQAGSRAGSRRTEAPQRVVVRNPERMGSGLKLKSAWVVV
jgi:superfamily II DNA/RNA helicase